MIPATTAFTPALTQISQQQAPMRAAGPEQQARAFNIQKAEPAEKPVRVAGEADPMVRVLDRVGVRSMYERFGELTNKAEAAEKLGLTREAQGYRTEAMFELQKMQIVAQDHHMKVELASKVVENGSSGAKTIFQTQV